jgi:hypothetical protein
MVFFFVSFVSFVVEVLQSKALDAFTEMGA